MRVITLKLDYDEQRVHVAVVYRRGNVYTVRFATLPYQSVKVTHA